MIIDKIIKRRRDALIDRFNYDDLPPLVEVSSPAMLRGMTFLEEFADQNAVERLGRRWPRSVAVSRGPGNPDQNSSVWVRSSYRDNRGAYREFLQKIYQVPATSHLASTYHVDHLLNRKRAGTDNVFLRIEAIPALHNTRWGAIFEKLASVKGVARDKKSIRPMNDMIAAKLLGLPPPRSSEDDLAIWAIARRLATPRRPEEIVRQGLVHEMEFLERNQPSA